MRICVFLFFVLSCVVFAVPVAQLPEQEMNLWSKLELSLQSTQNEIDGLRSLVNNLQMGSEKLTGELTLSRADYDKLKQLQESTANSYSQLSRDYNNLKVKDAKKDKWLWTGSIIAIVFLLLKAVHIVMMFKTKSFSWRRLWEILI